MIRLPGLIDPHVHLRFDQPHKEDFATGTAAALAGGYTFIIDMPNNNPPVTTLARLQKKIKAAERMAQCDIGFHFGSLGDNLDEFKQVKDLVYGLKLYLNQTTGGYIIDEPKMKKIYQAWQDATQGTKPILLHAEADVLPAVERVVTATKQPTHICHVSSQKELAHVISMKQKGLPVTCGVTPHHLFLTDKDREVLGSFGIMKPPLQTKHDQDFLWKHFNDIDIVESDHPRTPWQRRTTPSGCGSTASSSEAPRAPTTSGRPRVGSTST